MLKKVLYTIIFIACILQLVGFVTGDPHMPEVTDSIH